MNFAELGIDHHLAKDYSAWLTTVTNKGIPAPNPVWFVSGSEGCIVVLTPPRSRKVSHIKQRPTVSFHFNANRLGRKSAIIIAHVSITEGVAPSTVPGYLDKYRWSVEQEMGMRIEDFDQHATTRLLLQPIQVRRPPDGLSPDGVPPGSPSNSLPTKETSPRTAEVVVRLVDDVAVGWGHPGGLS